MVLAAEGKLRDKGVALLAGATERATRTILAESPVPTSTAGSCLPAKGVDAFLRNALRQHKKFVERDSSSR